MFNKRLIQRLTSAISYHTCIRFELTINMNINYRCVNIIQSRGNYLWQNYLKLIECDSRKSYIELLKILTDFNINFLPILYGTCELLQLHGSYYIIIFFIFALRRNPTPLYLSSLRDSILIHVLLEFIHFHHEHWQRSYTLVIQTKISFFFSKKKYSYFK